MTSDGHLLTVALLLFPCRYQRIPFFESLRSHKSFLKHYEIPSHQKTILIPYLEGVQLHFYMATQTEVMGAAGPGWS